jgi:predicted transcriptional regulator
MVKNLEKLNNSDILKRRTRLDIIAEILDAASGGAVKTRIMRKTNVNFFQFIEYAKYLSEVGLIEIVKVDGKTIYKTTEKGKLLLDRFNETEKIFNSSDSVEYDKPLIVKKRPLVYTIKR